ncbi:hypothetical protein F4677DRAFT_461730 [Hypoxylon crocopeplum]|nr:hypothetical protein F4677DRAFT_461730 [Hypoxylon crocopeplum]
MHTKTLFSENGNILGKIPIKTSEQMDFDDSSSEGSEHHSMPRRRPRERLVIEATVSQRTRDAIITTLEEFRTQARQARQQARSSGSSQAVSDERPRLDLDDALTRSRRREIRSTNSDEFDRVIRDYLELMAEERNRHGRRAPSANEAFFPSPMVTFLIDQPRNILCQICLEVRLEMAETADDPKESTPAILPCGHVCCHTCMSLCLRSNDRCPFCRENMTHPICRHMVKPKLIARDTIHLLPKTMSRGGMIAPFCYRCEGRTRRELAAERFRRLAEDFKNARRLAEETGDPNMEYDRREALARFENWPNEYGFGVANKRKEMWL